jgi:4-hydroxybenzoate polyprenyltransferase/phosphoserine phosphatase
LDSQAEFAMTSENFANPQSQITLETRSVEVTSAHHAGEAIVAETVIPLFVDLDGTLIATDLGQEAVLLAIKENPAILLKLPGWLKTGLAGCKRKIAAEVQPVTSTLPWHGEVIAELRSWKAAGRPIILATASDSTWAAAVAEELRLFDAVLASDGVTNLKGKAKLAAIEEYCRAHGWSQFEYWGDARADLPIWTAENSAAAVAVNPGLRVRAALRKQPRPVRIIADRRAHPRVLLGAFLQALRPQQWVKNLLLFIPLMMAHKWGTWADLNLWFQALAAFVSFSLCASAIYVLNDMFDVAADRRHPTKRSRPFASGAIPLSWGPPMSLALVAASFALALSSLPWDDGTAGKFLLVLAAYGLLNLFYTLWLKRHMVIDVMLLAGMYCLRVYIGGVATGVEVSEWLMAFAIFFFTSLAFAKRYAELARHADHNLAAAPSGRGYGVHDLGIIESVGPTSGYMSVLVLALYVNSPAMKLLYSNSLALWLICPLLMYWLTRLWFVAQRRELSEDPLVYAIGDRVSLLIAALIVGLALIATIWR